jgi:hypothetical protein
VHWSRLEEEGADSCRGEGKLSAGAVGVTEEGAATPVAAGRSWRKEDCCWPVQKLEGGGLLLWRLSLLRRPREALLGLLKLRGRSVAGVVLMGGRGGSVSLGLLEENERKGRGLPRFGFAGEGVVPCCWLPEGKWGCRDGRGESEGILFCQREGRVKGRWENAEEAALVWK